MERDVLRELPSLRISLRRGVARKVDKLATVRIGSARYSVPHLLRGQHVDVSTVDDRIEVWHQDELVAAHRLVPPGATSIMDEHYDQPTRKPARAVRPRSKAEQDFVALGEEAVAFLRAAAAAGTTRLPRTSPRSPLCATRTAPQRWPRHCTGRSSSAGSPPRTCARSWPPARPHRRRPRRGQPSTRQPTHSPDPGPGQLPHRHPAGGGLMPARTTPPPPQRADAAAR